MVSSDRENTSLESLHEPSSTAISILDTSQSKTLIAIANRVSSSRKPTNQQVTCSVRAGRGESCEEVVGECLQSASALTVQLRGDSRLLMNNWAISLLRDSHKMELIVTETYF